MDAPWTAIHDTPNKSLRQNVARRGVVLHHAAMTSLSTLRNMEVGGTKEVSSTAICKDDNLELVVHDDRYRPWSLSSAYWDSAMRSVETCNESTTGWTISDASHWSLAKAVAYWASTDGFWPHRDGDPTTWTVIGHREVYSIHDASYSTACPGGMDIDLVVRRAQGILNGTATAGAGTSPLEEDMPKAKLYRNADNGDMRIMNPETGLEVGITSVDYLTLMIGWKFFDGVTSNAPVNLPGNVFEYLRSLGASVRASAPVDSSAIAASVGGQVTAAVVAALADVAFDGDAEAIAAKVEQRLADEFAGIPAAVVDEQRDRLES